MKFCLAFDEIRLRRAEINGASKIPLPFGFFKARFSARLYPFFIDLRAQNF
jgi:hypothetical protein